MRISKYTVINENIRQIDTNGQKVLELFYLKTFIPYFAESNQFLAEIKGIFQSTFSVFSKVHDQKELYKKQKAFKSGKSDFYYHTNKVFEKVIATILPMQKESLESGINWYIKKLEEDISLFPQRLSILHDKEDFTINKKDRFGLKLIKIRKRISHPFSKKNIVSSVRFRDVAAYYLRDNRYQFLLAFLKKFEQDVIARLSNLRPLITEMDGLISKYEKQIFDHKDFNKEHFEQEKNDLLEKVQQIADELESVQELYRNRLFVEFRKNVTVMSADLEKVNVNRVILKKRRSRKFYKSIKIQDSSFPEEFHVNFLYYFNKINLDISLRTLKYRINDKLEHIFIHASQRLESVLMNKLETIKSDALQISADSKKIAGLKLDIVSVQESVYLQKEFENLREDMVALGNNLPENLMISSTGNF